MTLPMTDEYPDAAGGLAYDGQGGNTPSALVVRLEDMQTIVQRPEAPAFSQFSTYPLVGTEQPIQILTQAPKRKRAIVRVMPGLVDNNNLGYVVVGNYAQVMSNKLNVFNSGGLMVAGTEIEITGSSPVWLIPDGQHALTVLVLDERYQ